MGWRSEYGLLWIDHNGQHRKSAEVDDMLSWLRKEGFHLKTVEPIGEKYMVRVETAFPGTCRVRIINMSDHTVKQALTAIITHMKGVQ